MRKLNPEIAIAAFNKASNNLLENPVVMWWAENGRPQYFTELISASTPLLDIPVSDMDLFVALWAIDEMPRGFLPYHFLRWRIDARGPVEPPRNVKMQKVIGLVLLVIFIPALSWYFSLDQGMVLDLAVFFAFFLLLNPFLILGRLIPRVLWKIKISSCLMHIVFLVLLVFSLHLVEPVSSDALGALPMPLKVFYTSLGLTGLIILCEIVEELSIRLALYVIHIRRTGILPHGA